MAKGTEGNKVSLILRGFLISLIFFLSTMGSTALAGSYRADVVVVGAGGAGLAAANEAASKEASVIVVELDSTYGGTAAISGGGCFAVGTPLQKQKGYEDSPDLAFQECVRWGQGEARAMGALLYRAQPSRPI